VAEGARLGVDPGTAKCGLALLAASGEVSFRAVVSLDALAEAVRELAATHPLSRIALGSKTGSERVREMLEAALPGVEVEVVPEHRTTEEARELYWKYHPPRGWRRLMPRGMLVPPEPVDGYAAELLARRALR
jgi:hypothetical protein